MEKVLWEFNDDRQYVGLGLGGTVVSWKYDGVEIFYPQQRVVRAGNSTLRGGMHPCFPNFGPVDPEYGLPQHGTLRNRVPDGISKKAMMFSGAGLLGSCKAACKILILITLHQSGFIYELWSTLLEPAKNAFINPGLHPYFRTPDQGEAYLPQVGISYQSAATENISKVGPIYEPILRNGMGNLIVPKLAISGLGSVLMQLYGSVWELALSPRIVIWRDSLDYLCVEPIVNVPQEFGRGMQLNENWTEMSCKFTFIPQ